MEGFKPGTLGAELCADPNVTQTQARFFAIRASKDQFAETIPKPRQISLSAYSEQDRLTCDEQVEHDYEGLTPQNPDFFRRRIRY